MVAWITSIANRRQFIRKRIDCQDSNRCRNIGRFGRLIIEAEDDVIAAIHTGMRKPEIQNLKWSDINFQQGFITLLRTKNNERREVPMNKVVKEVIVSTPKHSESAYVFYGEYSSPFNLRKPFGKAIKTAEIKDFHFHDIRHAFASYMRMAGTDLDTIGEILGHKSNAMTKRYAHLFPDAKIWAVEKLSNELGTPKAYVPLLGLICLKV